MRRLILDIWTVLVTKIGRCTRCMRQSLTAALAAWGTFVIGLVIWPNSMGHDFVGVLAVGLTALWALHFGVYSIRAVIAPTEPKIKS